MTQTMTNEEFAKLLDETYTHKLNVVDVVKGVVVKKEKTGFLVDIGSKTEAFLPNNEVVMNSSQNPDDFVKLWDEKEFYVVKDEEDDEIPVLSLKKLSFAQSWNKLNDMKINNETVTATVVSTVKGGLIVEIEGLRGFIPASQLRAGVASEDLANKEIEAKILEADPKRNKLILSQRQAYTQKREEVIQEVLSKLNVDDVIEGEVVRIADFGVFVDINGIDGLLPISEISWDRIKHPSEIVSLGEKITVKVINIDQELKRVSLSLKRMTTDPWEDITEKFKEEDIIEGTINKITNFGIFINIYPGVEALLPSAEISDEHVNLNAKYNVGDSIKVQIKKFTPEEHRICLSVKDL